MDIKNNAPHGATHYRSKTGQFYKFDGIDWFVDIWYHWTYIKNPPLIELEKI